MYYTKTDPNFQNFSNPSQKQGRNPNGYEGNNGKMMKGYERNKQTCEHCNHIPVS